MDERRVNGTSTVGGTGFLGLLTIVFIVLKLCKVINWSWVWVLCPLWGGFLLTMLILVGFIIWIKRG